MYCLQRWKMMEDDGWIRVNREEASLLG